ncbi:MAG TPA: response regulator [Chitinophagaceae bacterium]|nr:response regulator [Chitinophagaceae bacterium]
MSKQIEILLVEDNEGDVVLTLEALQEAKVYNHVHVVRDGEEAIKFLKKQAPYQEAVTPDIILLDINLPKMDGKEVLTEIKKDNRLKTIPVVILTTSEAEKDISYAYHHHANCYITKPVDFSKFMEVVQSIKNFWISIVQLPKPETDDQRN